MTQTTAITTINIDEAYHLNCVLRGLTSKSKNIEFDLAISSLSRSELCYTRQDIEKALTDILHPARMTRKAAVKQTALDTARAYIASITK